MKVELHPKALEELEEFPKDVRDEIKNRLKELEENPTGHSNTSPINVKGRTVFKYKMKEGNRGGKLDHRAVYDIQNGKIMVYTIFHRDKGYQKYDIARRF